MTGEESIQPADWAWLKNALSWVRRLKCVLAAQVQLSRQARSADVSISARASIGAYIQS